MKVELNLKWLKGHGEGLQIPLDICPAGMPASSVHQTWKQCPCRATTVSQVNG